MVQTGSVGFAAIVPMAKNQPSGTTEAVIVFDATPDENEALFAR
jgi:hypothetical protein